MALAGDLDAASSSLLEKGQLGVRLLVLALKVNSMTVD